MLAETHLTREELMNYGNGKTHPCYYSGSWEELGCWERGCVWKDNGDCDGRCSPVERPPQSWMYVQELED